MEVGSATKNRAMLKIVNKRRKRANSSSIYTKYISLECNDFARLDESSEIICLIKFNDHIFFRKSIVNHLNIPTRTRHGNQYREYFSFFCFDSCWIIQQYQFFSLLSFLLHRHQNKKKKIFVPCIDVRGILHRNDIWFKLFICFKQDENEEEKQINNKEYVLSPVVHAF